MKHKARSLCGLWIAAAFLAARAHPASAALAVSHRTLDNGEVVFQVRGLSEPPLRLTLSEINGQRSASISNFEYVEEGRHFLARWTPSGEGVFAISLVGDKGVLWPAGRESQWTEMPQVLRSVAMIDRAKSRVIWTSQQTSLVRVLGKLRSGMFIRTLNSWHFSAPVRHEVEWDFWDAEGIAYYRTSRALRASVLEIPLPPHLVVVGKPAFGPYRNHALFREWEIVENDFTFDIRSDSREVRAHEAFPGLSVPVVGPDNELILTLSKATRALLDDEPFGVYVYLNGELFLKEPFATDPWRFSLPPGIAPSDSLQMVTVNVLDHHGGIGGKTMPIWYVEAGGAL